MKLALNKLKIAILVVLFGASVFTGAIIGWYEQDASAIPLIGGRSTIYAFCNDGCFVITVTPPRPGLFKVCPGRTIIYLYGQFASSWVLGDAWPGGVCCVGKWCFPVTGTARIIGTSAG